MDHQSNPTGTRQVGVSKKHYNPAELKASKKVPVSLSNDEENKVILPEPPIREVPVNVTRRSGPPVAVLPPPSNRHHNNTKPRSTVTRRDQKRRIHGGNGSDSDSDSDEAKQTNADDGVSSSRKKTPHQIDDDVGESSKAAIEAEELARVQQQRLLRQIGNAWGEISQDRKRHEQEAEAIISRLKGYGSAQHERAVMYDPPPMPKRVIDAEEILQEYLDEILYGHVKGTLDTSRLIGMEDIIIHVEEGVLRRFYQPDEAEFSEKPRYILLWEELSKLNKTVRTLKKVQYECKRLCEKYQHHWRHVEGSSIAMQSKSSDESCAPGAELPASPISRPVASKPVVSFDIIDQTDQERFDTAMLNSLAGKFWFRSGVSRHSKLIESRLSESVWFYLKQVHRLFGISIISTLLCGSPDDSWLDLIRESRQEERLTPEYIDWVTAGVGAPMLQDLRVRWRGTEVASQYKDQMKEQGMKISQEFCQGLIRPYEVALLLVKNNFPTGIQEVSPRDIFDLGWRMNDVDGEYWRCKPTDDRRFIVKVDMNGRILGVFGLEPGSQNWIFVEDQGYSRNPRSRQVSGLEKAVLGL